jgi:hypothetical protein
MVLPLRRPGRMLLLRQRSVLLLLLLHHTGAHCSAALQEA